MLPHQPQRVQDLPDIQGEQHPKILVMKDLISLSPTFIQPTEFNALDHERTFKIIMAGLFVFIILYVTAIFCILWQFDEAGVLFQTGWLESRTNTIVSWFIRVSLGVTALSILASIACGVYANGGFVTPTPNPPTPLILTNIPFNTLNLAIVIGIVVFLVLSVLFNRQGKGGLYLSAILLCVLLCNREARKHVRLRFRQLIDRFTIGGTNSVGPIATIALAVRPQNSTERWAEPSVRYTVTLPQFLDDMDVTDVTDVTVTLPEFLEVVDVKETSM